VTEFGIVTLVSPLQLLNAKSPIVETESGIVTLVSPLQPLNANFPIVVTESGIVTFPFLLPEKQIKVLPILLYNVPLID
jgi:hypothetical protein